MKNQVTFLGLLVLFTAAITSCKKDVKSLEDQMMGKWLIDKVITVDANGVSTTQTYSQNDYMNFALNVNSMMGYYPVDYQLHNNRLNRYAGYYPTTSNANASKRYVTVNQGTNWASGSFEINAGDRFRLFLSDGTHDGMVNRIESNRFQFTAKKYGSNLTKIYYLKR